MKMDDPLTKVAQEAFRAASAHRLVAHPDELVSVSLPAWAWSHISDAISAIEPGDAAVSSPALIRRLDGQVQAMAHGKAAPLRLTAEAAANIKWRGL